MKNKSKLVIFSTKILLIYHESTFKIININISRDPPAS